MNHSKFIILFVALIVCSTYTDDTIKTDISSLKTDIKTDPQKFIQTYQNKIITITGLFWMSIMEKDGYKFFPITGLDGKFEPPYVSCMIPNTTDNLFFELKHKDTLTINATVVRYYQEILYLDNVQIVSHKKYDKPVNNGNTLNPSQGKLLISALRIEKGSRSKAAVMRIIMQNLGKIRKSYYDYIKNGEAFSGKIALNFTIVSTGMVINSKVIENTTRNTDFAQKMCEIVGSWNFEKIDNVTDTTEVIYPFVFE